MTKGICFLQMRQCYLLTFPKSSKCEKENFLKKISNKNSFLSMRSRLQFSIACLLRCNCKYTTGNTSIISLVFGNIIPHASIYPHWCTRFTLMLPISSNYSTMFPILDRKIPIHSSHRFPIEYLNNFKTLNGSRTINFENVWFKLTFDV